MNTQKRYRLRLPHREGESDADRKKREKNWRYEEATVKHLIEHFDRRELARQLWSEHKSNDPEDFGRLTLPDFQRKSGFPVWLGARRISSRRLPPIGRFLREFGHTPMYGAFRETWRSVPESMQGQPVCAVFPVPGTKFMAIHTFESERTVETTRIIMPHRRLGFVATMEPLDNLLEALEAAELLDNLFTGT